MAFSPTVALQKRLVLLTGEEHELRRRALTAILDTAAEADPDFDKEEFDAGSSQPLDWVASAGTAPFISLRRVVVVRYLLRSDPEDVKLGGLPDTALLILVGDDENGDDEKQGKVKRNRTAWEKAVGSAGGLVETFAMESKDIKSTVKAEAVALGKKMSDPAADTLIEMTGSSLSRAVDELQKVAIFVGDKAEIREADIKAVVVPSREWNVFVLVDALLQNQPGNALRQLKILVGAQSKAEDVAFRNILPQVSRNLRLLWQARLCIDAKVALENVPDSISRLFPTRNNLLKEKPWVCKKVMQSARMVDLNQIARSMEIVSETDARLKGALSSYSAMETLERMVLEISNLLAMPARR